MGRIKLIDLSQPYYAARRFTMNGTEYQQNDVVPFDGLNERDVKRLIGSSWVTNIKPVTPAAVTPTNPSEPPEKDPHKAVDLDVNVKTGKLVHVNGGQYEVQGEDGANMLPEKVKGKDMAKMAAGQFGITVTE